MLFLPSLLEYSKEGLEKKLEFLLANPNKFKQVQNPFNQKNPKIGFHVDLVLPEFAKSRGVMTAIGVENVLESLAEFYFDKELYLSIHIMGELLDLQQVYKYLKGYNFNPKWRYLLLPPPDYIPTFAEFTDKNIELGVWLDLDQWNQQKITELNQNKIFNFLLMNVVAGKSGQKQQKKEEVIELTKNNPESYFIVDGGWNVDTDNINNNVDVVSYSSFWKALGFTN